MRIIIVGINFAPELTGVGKYTGEMAARLAQRGHRVTIVTAPPYYPFWHVRWDYRSWTWRRESWNDCSVIRCPIYVPQKASGLRRLAHLASFSLTSIPATIAAVLAEKPDIVISIAPTLMSSPVALAIARLTGAKSWLHIQDFEAEAASHLGLLPRPGLKRAAAAFERGLLKRFDLVSSISPKMVDRLLAKGVAKERALLFPNWVDTDVIRPLDRASTLRRELDLPEDRLIALYAGSMGGKQGLETLIEAARHLAKYDSSSSAILVVLAGDGLERAHLQAMAQGLSNVRFVDLQPANRLNELLNLADIHLLPQRSGVADLVMPSKLGPMLASGRPVIATVAPGTQVAMVIANSGIAVPPGDTSALVKAIQCLAADPTLRRRLGENARREAEAEPSAEQLLDRMEDHLRVSHGNPSRNRDRVTIVKGGAARPVRD